MGIVTDIVVWILLGVGSFFYLVGGIGLVRMPDLFTRMHATSVSETLGAGLLIIAMMLAAGWSLNSAKLLVILAILFFTGPVATHALAQAAITAGLKPQLAEDRTARNGRKKGSRNGKRAADKAQDNEGGGK
jgi:multicomponent Na+:H+ antiporter subunit G